MTLLTATLDDDGPRARLILRFGRIGLALAAGAATALAHPPFGFLPGLLGYALLMFLAERATSVRGAFWMGWLAGFAYFFIGCWWVAEAFFVNPEQAWMAPFAASLLPAGLGLFWGVACALYRRFAPIGVVRVLLFATLFCGYLEPSSGRFTYSNAGHLPPLLIQDGRCTELPLPRGLLAGVAPRATYRAETVQLNRGDLLFAYTDGLSEAENGEGQPFGIEPCRDLLMARREAPLPTMLDDVRGALTAFSGSEALEDDCTLLLLRRP
jgi:hypothetical protein